jgi:hypothetical protein
MSTERKLNTALLSKAMAKNGLDVASLSGKVDQHVGPVSAKLFQRWMDGSQQPSAAQIAYLATAVRLSKERLWSEQVSASEPSWTPFIELLKSGLFHQTTPSRLPAIIHSGEILPSGETPEAARLGLNTYSAAIKAVALFNFGRATDKQIRVTQKSWVASIGLEARTVFLRFSPAALPSPLQHYEEGMRKKVGAVHFLDHVESWHKGAIPWAAVDGCWEFQLDGEGHDTLTDLSGWLSEIDRLLQYF